MAKRIQVGGRIESMEVGGIVTGAAEILDDARGKKQSVINGETDDELLRLDQSKQDNLTFDNAPTEGSDNPVKSGGVYAADKALSDAIEAILLLIPSAASALNKLVDTAMMNSSISTATATFRGTYNVVTDLSLTVDATHEQIAAALGNAISTADNNDYAFVQVPVSEESTDIRRTERYKFNGTAWGYEYDLNTSGFTDAQWAAINSGITLALVGKLIGLPTSAELQALLGQKQDTLAFDNIPVSGSANPVKSGGVYSAINDEKTAREQLAQTVTGIDGRVENVEGVIPTGAAANNKLVANNSMEAYVTSIIDAITASFTIATADGHINLTLTQTNGRVASLTLTSSDIASAQALTALTGRVTTAEGNITTINGNITSLGGRVSTNETDIANLQQLYNDLQQSKPVPVTDLPSTGQQQGVIYRLAGTTSYSDYMWNGSTWVLMATYNNAIDPRPKKASQNLVTSGGVFDNMGALDVSELNATENPHTLAQYVDLSAALAAIPTDYQKGGMSIKFVQSSDNKYVQYRLMSDTFNTTTTNWQGVDEKPTPGSDNLAESGGVYGFATVQKELTVDDTITGKYIYSNGSLADNNAFNVLIYEVSEGDMITVTISNGSGSARAYEFYNTTDKSQIGTSTLVLPHGPLLRDANGTVTIVSPCDGIFAVSKFDSAVYSISKHIPIKDIIPPIEFSVSKLQSDVDDLNDIVINSYTGELVIDDVIQGKYISDNGNLGENDGFLIRLYKVKEGDSITLTISNGVGFANSYGFYETDDPTLVGSSTVVLPLGPALKTADGTHNLVAPADGFLAISYWYETTYSVIGLVRDDLGKRVERLETKVSQIQNLPIQYIVSGDTIKMSYGFGNNDMVVTLSKHGGNNLFDFANFSTMEKNGDISTSPKTNILSISTDWHGPFIIAAVDNIDGDDINSSTGDYNHTFTGGNHQYNNTGSGSTPTARTTSLDFFADGLKITDGDTGYAQEIKMKWTNLVQAYNTKKADGSGREVLQENHILTLKDGVFSMENEIVLLEDVVMETYYGIQYSGIASVFPKTVYIGGINRGINTTTPSESGNAVTRGMKSYGDSYAVQALIDTTWDLGSRILYQGTKGCNTSGNKGYFYVVTDATMEGDTIYNLRGSWEILLM